MLFHSITFLFAFVAFFASYHLASRSVKILLTALMGCCLYGLWNLQWLPLLIAVVLLHFFCARAMGTQNRLHFLILGLGFDLFLLAWFKFVRPTGTEHVFLPIGLSFYVFQCMGYLIDVYRQEVVPVTSFGKFFSSVSFFPHLPSGPILSTKDLTTQFDGPLELRWENCEEAFFLFSLGALKKNIADLLAPFADSFLNHSSPLFIEGWTGGLAFTGQIYGDFSGYSDMAMALGLFLGIRLPLNFNVPFLATSPSNFWSRHWHLSLGNWVRSYVYLPLALKLGRKNVPPTVALFLTMIVMGLWHGSGFNYVVFGFFVACTITGTNAFFRPEDKRRGVKALQILLTNYLTVLGFVIFRTHDWRAIVGTLSSMHVPDLTTTPDHLLYFLQTLLGLAVLVVLSLLSHAKVSRNKVLLWGVIFVMCFITVSIGKPGTAFIYFQY